MDDLDPQLALMAIKHGLPFVQSGANFEIYAANEAFEELLGYSSFELKRKGWDSISVKNDDFEADKAMTAELVSGNRQVMTVIKSYVSKLGVPIPGQLTAIRFPQGTAPMECSLCFFVPLTNGSKAALSLVTEYIEKHTNASHTMAEKIATMSQDLQLRKGMTVGERLWENFGQWALQNPKVATVVFLILLSLNPFPIIITWVTRMGWLPATPVQIEVQDGHGALRPATSEDLQRLGVIDGQGVADRTSAMLVRFETKRGTIIEVGDEHGMRTVSSADRGGSVGDRGTGFGDFATAAREEREARNHHGLMDAISNVSEWAGIATFRNAETVSRNAKKF